MVQRPRIFSHDTHNHRHNTHNQNQSQKNQQPIERAPLATTSEADLNSQQFKEPVVKRLINKPKWAFMKPRSVSSPPGENDLTENTSYKKNNHNSYTHTTESLQHSKSFYQPSSIVSLADDVPRIDDRSVILHGIPSSIGLNSVIAQTSGGPLERIETKYETSYPPKQFYSFEFFFMIPEQAKEFFAYAMSGRFLVNGKVYKPTRGSATLTNQNSRSKQLVSEMNGPKQLRRCLVLNKPTKLPKPNLTKADPKGRHRCQLSAYNPNLELNFNIISQHFSKYGVVVNIQPIITQCISVSIQFADVRAAVKAKNAFDRKEDVFGKKYSGWTLAFGKDPVDKSCPVEL